MPGNNYVWIGLYNPNYSGKWEWSDGSSLDYTFWYTNPTNTNLYAYARPNAGNPSQWYVSGEANYYSICQKYIGDILNL